jgi:hypothetical protein
MKIRLLAVIVASGLALASTLVEARGPGGGQSMGGGYGIGPAQTQQANMPRVVPRTRSVPVPRIRSAFKVVEGISGAFLPFRRSLGRSRRTCPRLFSTDAWTIENRQ